MLSALGPVTVVVDPLPLVLALFALGVVTVGAFEPLPLLGAMLSALAPVTVWVEPLPLVFALAWLGLVTVVVEPWPLLGTLSGVAVDPLPVWPAGV